MHNNTVTLYDNTQSDIKLTIFTQSAGSEIQNVRVFDLT